MENIFRLANIHAFVDKPFQVSSIKEMLDKLCGIEAQIDTLTPKEGGIASSGEVKKLFTALGLLIFWFCFVILRNEVRPPKKNGG